MNACVSRITQRQVVVGGFIDSPPTLEASEDKDDDGDADAEDGEDDGASSSSADEMST